MAWTFAYQGLPGGTPEEHSLVWWGISEPTLTFVHAQGDEARFSIVDEDAFASAPLLIPGPTGLEHRVWFTQDGVVRFVGVIVENPRASTAGGQSRSFVIKGVGSLLARIIYHQSRLCGISPDYVLLPREDSHVWLGQDPTGTRLNTGQQLAAILTYAEGMAAGDGHLFQHDASGFPSVNFLLDEGIGLTCEQAMIKMLAFSPDYVAWWDYSTLDGSNLPKPTLRCASRAAAELREISIHDGDLNASPRYELLSRAVAITYEQTVQVDNESRVAIVKDIYPPTLNGSPTTGREIGALAVTVPLQGSRSQTFSAAIACEAINAAHPDDAVRRAWWLSNFPALANSLDFAAGDELTIEVADVERSGVNAYPRRLLPGSGGIAPWMNIGSEEETITVRALISDKTGEEYKDLSVKVTATNGVTGAYGTSVLLDAGEPVPSGLARSLYDSLSGINWQGDFKLVEQEVGFSIKPGSVLNVTDAEVGLQTARLMVWRLTVDVFNGTSTAEFGDPENLGIGDMVDRLRAFRLRNLSTIPTVQSTGLAGGGSAANLPSVTPRGEVSAKTHEQVATKLSSPDPAVTQAMNAALSQLPVGSVAQFRQFSVCIAGVTKTAYFLATEPV